MRLKQLWDRSEIYHRALTFLFCLLTFCALPAAMGDTTLVPTGATWRYLDNGTNQGTAWRGLAFADGSWASGPAELGYGDIPDGRPEATVIEDDATPGSPTAGSTTRYITSYFRHVFTVTDKAGLTDLMLRVKRDDGAAVYLNGTVISDTATQNGLSINPGYTDLASNATDDGAVFQSVNLVNGQNLLVVGDNIIAVEVHQTAANSSDVSFDLSLTAPTVSGLPISAGASWKYLANGTDQGTAWREPAFSDTIWSTGLADLGYGDGDEATVVSFGSDARARYVTTYFRKTFSVTNPQSSYTALKLRLLRDDGAVVYLNGIEARRDNLPAGAISYTTLASKNIDYPAEDTFFETTLPVSTLVNGTNTVAVEVHQARRNSSDLSFDLELIGVPPITSTTDTRAPYLQMGTPTSVVIRWRTGTANDSRVSYGLAPAALTMASDDTAVTKEHEVLLTGLTPNTQYYYSVGSTTVTQWSGVDFTFFTAPPVGTQQPVRIWVLGDPGTGTTSQTSVRNAYTTYNGTRYTNLWLMLGDNAYNDGTDSQYTAKLFNIYPTTLRQSVLWPTIGNHDTGQNSNPALTIPYFQSFTLPTNAEAGGIASGTEKYYSFDFANIHFICLDSMTSDRSAATVATGVMARWLIEDLNSTNQEWIIAYWHHPVYSKGSHNSDNETESIQMRSNFLPILEAGGVDLVLAGHSHNYERSFLLNGHYGPSTTFIPEMKLDAGSGRDASAYQKLGGGVAYKGAVYITCGTSGQIGGGAMNHPAMYISMANLGSMVFDVSGPRLDVKYLRETGATDDYFTILKTTPPPTGLTATPGDGLVTLSWSAVETATSYSVKRATTGAGPYLVLATGLTQTLYIDANLTNGQPYFYVVSASNASGESANSPAVSATPAPPPPPAAPTNLTAAAATVDSIDLTWTDNATNERGFHIERSSDGVTFAEIASVGADVTAYSSIGLRAGRTYYFRVRAYHESGTSDYSNVLSAATQ